MTPFQAKAASSRQSPPSGSSGAPSEKGEKGAASAPRARGRRRAKWKLKFHHQALPPEYLDHYEAAMAQEAKAAAAAAAEAATSPPVPSLIRIEKAAPADAGTSKGSPAGGKTASNKGGRRVPNFIQDLQLKETHSSQHQKTSPAQCAKPESAEGRAKQQEDCGIGPRLLVKGFPMSETTVSSSVKSSPELAAQHAEKRSSVIIASGLAGNRPEAGGSSSLRDLPYMGEMTLDCKPRRGRKPKKADICHLIYKNYGNVFSPSNSFETINPRSSDSGTAASSPTPSSPSSTASSLSPSSSSGAGKIELGHRGFSATDSLLAKRLTQSQDPKRSASHSQDRSLQDEPLNLCIRDLKRINVSGPFFPIKTEPIDGADDKRESPSKKRGEESDPGASGTTTISLANAANFPGVAAPVAGNYIYWPNAGVFVHPMALQSHLLYCQKMGAAAAVAAATASSLPLISPNILPDKPKQREGDFMTTVEALPVTSLSLPGTSSLECAEIAQTPAFGRGVTIRPAEVARVPSSSDEVPAASSSGRKRIVHSTSLATKRKRSAIFIPPTAENPTEVSICKFKFTGGAKPSLEEKKMLSVDAGGNFRYYSGTGDKSMRGYEFFPREQTLQPQYMGSSIGSLISAKPPTPSSVCPSSTPSAVTSSSSSPSLTTVNVQHFSNDPTSPLISSFVPDSPVARGDQPNITHRSGRDSLAFHRQGDAIPVVAGGSGESGGAGGDGGGQNDRKGSSSSSGPRRKRRTRKSLVREKLEQTFREKGFLIQTQQLESAEGATYCKFRQLRKFTRYLFRSWKDYLPGNIKEISSSTMIPAGGRPESGDQPCIQPAIDVSGGTAPCPPHE
ncbi:hypothetical protein J437_LFUL006729 [Ladona fulva]|uniref:Uncharacterized protein n=1 Tax=Ladona fulva TaxID=123851 RepID=A0A8K0NVH8_LADFU|nr:hypothetical protein J437_LFUL006729 [Ladona fulva]